MSENKNEATLSNMIEAQKKLSEAISKFADAEYIRAKADENNSLANLNYSKVMQEDRDIIRKLMEVLSSK